MLIFDGHNDALTRYTSGDADWVFLDESPCGHLDLPRARRGGFAGGFFAIFPSIEAGTWFPRTEHFHRTEDGFRVDMPPPLSEAFAIDYTERIFARLQHIITASDGALKLIREAADLDDALDPDSLAIVLHFEGAEALGADLDHFDEWYARGLRSIGPVWSRENAFGTGVPFAYPAGPDIGPGLKDAGFELVRRCDASGVVIDLAHLNEAGFWDVARTTTRPLVVTHTAAHALSPKPRNLTDRQIDAVGESGGVIGITFFTGDLEAGLDPDPDVSLDAIVRHTRYIAERIGTAHVALGSDFDGAPIPAELADACGLPRLVDALRKSGFEDDELAQICHGNWLRLLRETLR